MGADFTLEQNGKLYPVLDVTGDAFVIDADGKEQRIPMSRGAAKVKITPALKLTESSAELGQLKTERAYTAANDPEVAFQKSLMNAAQLNADSIAAANQVTAQTKQFDATSAAAAYAASKDSHAPQIPQSPTVGQQNAALSTARVLGGPGSVWHPNNAVEGAEGNYDAMDVSFELSAPRALGRPFLVFVAQYRPPGAKPGQVANWIYARALKPIGRTPTAVHVEQGGFPPGFELQELQIHLYDQGEEIATNVSSKRVALTSMEAQQFLLLDYVGSHKGATLPAVPAMGHLPADFPARLARGELKQVVYVKVAADGKPMESFRDRACSEKIDDPYVGDVVGRLFFKPALAGGKPVDSVAAVDLSKLVL